MWKYLVLIAMLCSIPVGSNAFWWPKATTETPRSQVLHQIPLTYFRTYTYQPLTGESFGVPLFGFGAAQTPLLSGRHYDPYAVTSYAAARRHDAAVSNLKSDVTPPAMGGGSNNLVSTTPAPTSTTSTTTTTTTTTPAPTTTSTTTTTTTSAPPSPPTSSSTTDPTISLRYASYNAEYPTYTRRVNNMYNARPQYPYPDYFNYQPPSPLAEKSGTRIQFVPCMCPISMPSLSGHNSVSATSTDRDRPSGVSLSSPIATVPAFTAATAADPSTVQARHADREDSELEEEEEGADGSNWDVSSGSVEETSSVFDSKVAGESANTTSIHSESNNLA